MEHPDLVAQLVNLNKKTTKTEYESLSNAIVNLYLKHDSHNSQSNSFYILLSLFTQLIQVLINYHIFSKKLILI